MSRGSSLKVRHTHLGDVYRFKTKVIGTNQKPFKVTYLSYPDVVEKIEFRDSQRVHCFFPATLAYNDMQVKGMVSDISLGGCKFRTDDIEQVEGLVLKKEGSVTVRFPLLGLDGIRAFDGKIKKIEFDVSFSLGIGFRDLDEPSSGVITSYIESAREYHI